MSGIPTSGECLLPFWISSGQNKAIDFWYNFSSEISESLPLMYYTIPILTPYTDQANLV